MEPYERGRRRRRLNPRFVILCLSAVLLALTVAVITVLIGKSRGLPGEGGPGEELPVPDYVEKDYLPVNQWSRPGEPLEKIRGVVIHYVGNPGTSAQANRNYFASLSSQLFPPAAEAVGEDAIQIHPYLSTAQTVLPASPRRTSLISAFFHRSLLNCAYPFWLRTFLSLTFTKTPNGQACRNGLF